METLAILPPLFWLSLVGAIIGMMYAWSHRREAWGIPAMVVCATVILWYHGDALYNEYEERHKEFFDDETLDIAWLQVIGFIVAFLACARSFHFMINRRFLRRQSCVCYLLAERDAIARVQPYLKTAFRATAIAWMIITTYGLVRTQFDLIPYFFPYLAGARISPWARGQLGSGMDAVLSLISYVDVMCMASFGVVAALARPVQMRVFAAVLVVLSWPAPLFDRNRNIMLAVLLPSILAFVFLRLRNNRMLQIGVLVLAFFAVDTWFRYVLANRHDGTILSAQFGEERRFAKKHEGLNMFEELAWIGRLTAEGNYVPNWGYRYYAELCNPIPRTLWPEKPKVGFDYAIARGFGTTENGVSTTIATGMVGQGVVNFGPWFGPLSSAILMSLWTSMLARFDLTPEHAGRMLLYALGIVLTFNMGRDITLLVVYPILFGYLVFTLYERYGTNSKVSTAS